MKRISKPDQSEYDAFYSGYIAQVGDKDVMVFIAEQTVTFLETLQSLEEDKLSYAYAEGKWTIAELLGHIIDVERIMAYRILRFSRKDHTEIPGFEQDLYVENGLYENRGLTSLIAEFKGLRDANIELVSNLTEEQSQYMGVSSGFNFSVRALVYILAGHVVHHLDILQNRYI